MKTETEIETIEDEGLDEDPWPPISVTEVLIELAHSLDSLHTDGWNLNSWGVWKVRGWGAEDDEEVIALHEQALLLTYVSRQIMDFIRLSRLWMAALYLGVSLQTVAEGTHLLGSDFEDFRKDVEENGW